MACKEWPDCPCGSQDDCAEKAERRRRKAIISDAVKEVASWPEWKRRMFEAFSKREHT